MKQEYGFELEGIGAASSEHEKIEGPMNSLKKLKSLHQEKLFEKKH